MIFNCCASMAWMRLAIAFTILAVVCESFFTIAVARAQSATWPWATSEVIAGCEVGTCTAHAEFRRCALRCGPVHTGVEIVPVDPRRPVPEWSSVRYRLQPAPGADPPSAVLEALRDRLRAWDSPSKQAAALQLAPRSSPSPARWPPEELALVAMTLVALAGAVALRVQALSFVPIAQAALPFAIGCLVAAVVRWWLGAAGVPIAWLTSLHEGTTSSNIALLHGHNLHAGPLYGAIVHLCAHGDVVSVRDIAVANATLASGLVAGGIAAALASGNQLGAVTLALLTTVPAAQLLAWSEAEMATAAVGMVAALPALITLGRRGPVRDRRAAMAFAHLGLCTVLTGMARTELAGFGVVGLAWHAVRFFRGDAELAEVSRHVAFACHRYRKTSAAVLIATAASAWPVNDWVDPGSRWTWLLAGAHPLNPTILAAPALAAALVPVALCVVMGLGLRRLWRDHLPGWGWAVVAAVVLFRVWFAASHRVFFELVRYSMGLSPIVIGLCLLGASEATEWLRRLRPAWPRNSALLGVGVAMAMPAWLGPAALVWEIRPAGLSDLPLLDRDQQAEVRTLAELHERFVGCAWLTPIHPAVERKGAAAQTAWLAFGSPLRSPRRLEPRGDPASALRELAPEAPCGLLFRGLDCHLVQGPECGTAERGRTMLWSSHRPTRTYSDPIEYGALRPAITFAVFQLW